MLRTSSVRISTLNVKESTSIPMKQVLVVGPVGSDTGGIAQYVNEQLSHLDEYQTETHDISPPEGKGLIWTAFMIVDAIGSLLTFAMRERPDVVHVHSSYGLSFARASAYVISSRFVLRRPIVLHIHGSSFDDFVATDSRMMAWYQSAIFGLTCRVIVLSAYWEDVIAKRVDEERIRVLPNAIDPDDYNPDAMSSVPHIVVVSNLIERKGIPDLVQAISRLQESESKPFQVTIAGTGPLSDEVGEVANMYDTVEYQGYVSEEEKRVILEEGTVYALPSRAEGLPIGILEGMAAGNAIVSTDVGSIPEVIGEKNGRIVSPGEVTELRQAITYLVQNPDVVEDMAAQNIADIDDKYSWHAIADHLEAIYDDCVIR
jgi:glycosyltransferase involved in cell wall biosynthesis